MIGYVIGNGLGRKDFDLEQLRDKGLIVGCNAIYRDFTPDFVTFVDNAMGQELIDCCQTTVVGQKSLPGGKARKLVHKPHYRNSARSSGALATDFAIVKGCDTIYWIGFDNPKDKKFHEASLYAKTKNYTRSGKWGYQCFIQEYKEIINYYKTTTFYNVIREGISNPMKEELGKFPNYNIIDYDTLVAQLD